MGVGDKVHEWHDWTGKAYHVRRRLRPDEEVTIGCAIDLRRTEEAAQRFLSIRHLLPVEAVELAIEEMELTPSM